MKQTNRQPINFMKLKSIYFILSLSIILPGLISLIRFGLKPSIDFTGGALIEIDFPQSTVTEEQIQASVPHG